jgi:hypothetical protein
MTSRAVEASPQLYARIAAGLYLGTIVAGSIAAAPIPGRVAANVVATLCYVGVSVLFYFIFRPVSPALSLIAAVVSLLGCAQGALRSFGLGPRVSALVFFGVYCLLIGYLVWKSGFVPRVFGVLMAIGGLGWLTFARPALAGSLAPWNMLPGVIGETALTLWLLIKGLDVAKWKEAAGR